ncbi:uncharacterized protein LOC122004518 [Zingiber officinale]|uniref:uncharacterized protein LOC122004518 n=1 Tax=Zingiber officinale TaxID=94328 RepID=UPI001C4D6F39|nr:uncharacterized protein LOC122004518 [Zingiber officinale]
MASPSFLPSLASILYPGSSSFDECARDDLRYTYGVEDDVQVIIPTGIHQFFNPPCANYPGPPTYSIASSPSGAKKKAHFDFNPVSKLLFYHPYRLLTPSWRDQFFFIAFPRDVEWPLRWQQLLPSSPELGEFHLDSSYLEASSRLAGWRINLMRLLSEELLSYFRLSNLTQETPRSLAEVLTHVSEVHPLPLSDMEIMRRGRVFLQRRALPHSSSTSIGGAFSANPPPRLARRGSPAARPTLLAHPTRPRTTRPPRPATPARLRAARPPRPATPTRPEAPTRPRAPRTAQPTPPTPLLSVSPPRATYILGRGLGERLMGLGGRTGNVPLASPSFREASQAACRARATNEHLSQNAPTPSRRRARSSSDDSNSDDQPLSQRRRRQAPRPMPDSGPSSIPSPPPNAAVSPPSPHVTPPPIPSHVTDPPTSSNNQAEPPLAHPSTSQHAQDDEAGPSERPYTLQHDLQLSRLQYLLRSLLQLLRVQPPSLQLLRAYLRVPQDLLRFFIIIIVLPSLLRSNYGLKQMFPPAPQDKRSSGHFMGRKPATYEFLAFPGSDGPIRRAVYQDTFCMFQACAESLIVNHFFHATHYQNKMLRDQVAKLELQLNDPVQASHALRVEIKDLTKKKNSLELSLALTNHELRDLQEKQSQADNLHQQIMNQQAIEHQRVMDQLAQKLRAAETLVQDQDQKLKSQEALLKSQEAQLTSQATLLSTARSELAQVRATTEGVSAALTIYREGENNSCL